MSNQVDRAFQIIEYLAKNGISEIDEICKGTEIPRSTIFKLLSNLESLGYTLRTKNVRKTDYWYLTLKLLKISKLVLSRIDFKNEIKDVLTKLSKDVNEIVQLGVYHNKKVMYIDVVKKPESIISFAGVGTELDINVSAAGMVLAAALTGEELDDLLNNIVLPKNTIYTITKPKELREELKYIASNGYAFDNQQWAIGVRCLAAPVFNFEEKVIGAINVTGHISTMSDDNIDFIKEKVIKAASEASKIMGYKSN